MNLATCLARQENKSPDGDSQNFNARPEAWVEATGIYRWQGKSDLCLSESQVTYWRPDEHRTIPQVQRGEIFSGSKFQSNRSLLFIAYGYHLPQRFSSQKLCKITECM